MFPVDLREPIEPALRRAQHLDAVRTVAVRERGEDGGGRRRAGARALGVGEGHPARGFLRRLNFGTQNAAGAGRIAPKTS